MRALVVLALAVMAGACQSPGLVARVAELEARVQQQEDVEAVRRLAFSYGYYMDNALMDEVTSLVARDAEFCEITGYGRYNGREGCLKIWNGIIGAGLQNADGHLRFGRLIKHYLVKDVISIDPAGKAATGRFDYIGYSGIFGEPARTTQQIGVYRMGFLKEEGVWKISRFQLSFDAIDWNYSTWASNPGVRCPRPGAPPPDGPPSVSHSFPEVAMAPFDDVNPVTGKAIESYVNPMRHWRGNWPGEFGGECSRLPNAPTTIEPAKAR